MLVNLAQVLLEAGYAHASLRAFAAVLVKESLPRTELGALGGVCLAAANSRTRAVAHSIVSRAAARIGEITAAVDGGLHPRLTYECAYALVEASEALAAIDEIRRSQQFANLASQISSQHGFHQLTHRLENPRVLPRANVQVSDAQQAIIRQVESLEGEELLSAQPS